MLRDEPGSVRAKLDGDVEIGIERGSYRIRIIVAGQEGMDARCRLRVEVGHPTCSARSLHAYYIPRDQTQREDRLS